MENCNKFFKNARWVGSDKRVSGRKVNTLTPSLRAINRFDLTAAPKAATVRVSGVGAFVLYINGQRVSDEVLSPAFTNYQKTVLFCEYEVGAMLKEGTNTVAIEVGAGFYNQTTKDVWSFCHAAWRDAEKFILSLAVDSKEVLVSDCTWRVNHNGPRYHTQIRQGEYYDATKEDGWLARDFDIEAWDFAKLVSPPGGVLKKQELPPIRICEKLAPVSKKRGKDGIIFDFGKNISGVCRLKMSAPRGTEVKINYGERLSDDGMSVSKHGITMHVECEEQYTDKYVFRGEGKEEFTPEFVYHGFQFAEVVGAESDDMEIEALFIHTDVKEKGTFTSSSEVYNWIVNAGVTAFLSNYHGFSEDCPHREKNGWTGDAVISVHHAVMRYDMKEAYKKWLLDMVDAQLPTGQLPGIAPTAGWGYVWGCGPAWDCALFAIPEAIWRETGDTECFDLVYDAAVKYLEYAKLYEDEDGIVGFGLGDWCPPLDENGKEYTVASREFSDCCHYIMMLKIMATMCNLRSEPWQAEVYEKRAERILSATRARFLSENDVDNGTASARALAIYYGIAEGGLKQVIADKLAKQLADFGYRVPCGILGMKAIFTALSETGHIDAINALVNCEEYPSYGFWRKKGATSLWEAWDENTASRNHHMYSEVLQWIYRYVGGIKNRGIAYDKCEISPYIFADDARASVSTQTPRGTLAVSWVNEGGMLTVKTQIPEGTLATFKLGNTEIALPVGENTVQIAL